jgi:D-beta-D-heptose 7-phosphate kinase/D-beta-D-heptose 1-phosphate adenosyltransferase
MRTREDLRKRGQRVVFTNGCFDILHRGHVEYLREAKQLGDVLIVAVNSDSSIRRLKGTLRPIMAEEDRTVVLAALEMVDYVTLFEEDTPIPLLQILHPDILVKGGDYREDEVVGSEVVREYGGEVVVTHKTDGVSTSEIIEQILQRFR